MGEIGRRPRVYWVVGVIVVGGASRSLMKLCGSVQEHVGGSPKAMVAEPNFARVQRGAGNLWSRANIRLFASFCTLLCCRTDRVSS